jgi:hypothetical protein
VAHFGCCWSVFGVAASWARLAIHASYSGEPRRGGASAGSPPIQGGMSAICSPTVRFTVLHDERERTARQRKVNLVEWRSRFMPDLCARIVASQWTVGADPCRLPALPNLFFAGQPGRTAARAIQSVALSDRSIKVLWSWRAWPYSPIELESPMNP